MKIKSILFMTVIFFFAVMTQDSMAKNPKKYKLNTSSEKLGYSLGSDIGISFIKNELDIDKNAFIRGFLDGLSGKEPLLSIEERKLIQEMSVLDMRKRLSERRVIAAEESRRRGAIYCAENARKRGVMTTPSGLQYKILKKGDGPVPKDTDKVQINYIGTLVDGIEFDNSYLNGKSSIFAVKNVIPGMSEAILMMPVGSKWKIVVPSELAYKDHGAGEKIGPYATLIFEIELLGIDNSATEDELNNEEETINDSLENED